LDFFFFFKKNTFTRRVSEATVIRVSEAGIVWKKMQGNTDESDANPTKMEKRESERAREDEYKMGRNYLDKLSCTSKERSGSDKS
jgi:hypothetical protein